MDDYPMGATVRYSDRGSVHQDDDGPTTCAGMVNGAPITNDDGRVLLVPVYTERDHGREATTIFVRVENIISVEPPA